MDSITEAIVNLVSGKRPRPTIPAGPITRNFDHGEPPFKLYAGFREELKCRYGKPEPVFHMIRDNAEVQKELKPLLPKLRELENIAHTIYDAMTQYGVDATRSRHMANRAENARKLAEGADPATLDHRSLADMEKEADERRHACKMAFRDNTIAMHKLLLPVFETAARIADQMATDEILAEWDKCERFGFPRAEVPTEYALALHDVAVTLRRRAENVPDQGGFLADISLHLAEL